MVRIFTKIRAPFFGLWCVYFQKSLLPFLWIMVSIFTKISAPCFMDYGAYIYKNQCTVFHELWCVYFQKSVHPVLWIMVRIFTKSVHTVLWIIVRIFTKISAPCFLDYGAYISLVTLPCITTLQRVLTWRQFLDR